MLEQEPDFEVTYHLEIEKALEESRKNPFDVYLFDMHMPHYSGLELAKDILEFQEDAKIILYILYIKITVGRFGNQRPLNGFAG